MKLGLVARKCGMTRVFDEDGNNIPVTVLHVDAAHVSQIKTDETDGYNAIQIAYGEQKPSRMTKSMISHCAKAGVKPAKGLKEFRVDQSALEDVKVGQELTVSLFEEGSWVDVTGVSKGHGFTGPVKRHNFKMQDATHGNSLSHRAHGSTGQNQTPGRVFKGKKMAGQDGNTQVTIQNLKVVSVDEERRVILVRGSIPGSKGKHVIIKHSIKHLNDGGTK